MAEEIQKTNEVNATAEIADTKQNSGNVEGSTPAADKAKPDKAPQQTVEKMLSQSEVNDLVGRVKKESYGKGKRDGIDETIKTSYQQPNQVDATFKPAAQQGDQFSEDRIRQIANEEAMRRAQYETAQRIAEEFTQKMMSGKDKHPDFEKTIEAMNLPEIAGTGIIQFANSLDNTADVMYELGKNRSKFANLLVLASSPALRHLAVQEMTSLSESIKKNQEGAEQLKNGASEPLSQVKPSTTGTDNGSMSVKDYKKMLLNRRR